MKREFDYDENDSSWADRELIWPAVLIVGAALGLIGLFLWAGW